MTATAHALVGTVIAAKVGNPALAIPIAIASHYICDAVPHWDTGYDREIKSKQRFVLESMADVILGFVLSIVLIFFVFPGTNYAYAFLIILMAQLPDWTNVPYLFLNWDFPPFSWSYELGKRFDTSIGLPWGVVNQLIVVVGLILFAKVF